MLWPAAYHSLKVSFWRDNSRILFVTKNHTSSDSLARQLAILHHNPIQPCAHEPGDKPPTPVPGAVPYVRKTGPASTPVLPAVGFGGNASCIRQVTFADISARPSLEFVRQATFPVAWSNSLVWVIFFLIFSVSFCCP